MARGKEGVVKNDPSDRHRISCTAYCYPRIYRRETAENVDDNGFPSINFFFLTRRWHGIGLICRVNDFFPSFSKLHNELYVYREIFNSVYWIQVLRIFVNYIFVVGVYILRYSRRMGKFLF